MRKNTEKKLLALGFDTNLITKIGQKGLTSDSLSHMSNEALKLAGFTDIEVDLIIDKTKRKAIDQVVIDNILEKSGEICCYCADGDNTKPFHIHHMDEYHVSKNNNEENLALVCPNHHANVHSKKISIEEQKAKKAEWENLWQIANEYKKKGLSFPFGAFDIVDYTSKGSIIDVFSLSSPKGSVCVQLTNGTLADQSLKTLTTENKLIVAGDSGSGKTTLVKGIAGKFPGYLVFKHVVSDKTSNEIAKEVLHFLNLTQKKLILIIDDANTKLEAEQIEKILAAADVNKKIILVNTRSTFTSKGNFEQHFQSCVEHISWPMMQTGSTQTLISSESEIIDYFNEKGINDFSGHKIGYTTFDYSFEYVISRFAKDTNTIWQFIYMLSGGLSRIEKNYDELHAADRMDIPLLYISIKQIAKVEEGATVDEILELYKRNSVLNKKSVPSKEWLNYTLNELCDNRVLKRDRDRFKTVHREFAKKVIDVSYTRNSMECSELLDEIFKNHSKVREIMILQSWMKYGEAGRYTRTWEASLTIEEWKNIGNEAVKEGLGILAILAEFLHSTTLPNHSKIANEVFKDKAQILADLINEGKDGTLYHFQKLSTTLRYHCSEVIKPLMDKIDQRKFADLIKNSSVRDFQSLSWLFYAIYEKYVEWLYKFSENLSYQDLINILIRNEKGNIDAVYDTIAFYRKYFVNLKRSEFRNLVGIVGAQLKNCSLEEINFPKMYVRGLIELVFLKEDVKFLLSSLDVPRLTKEFETATPRSWDGLLAISLLAARTNPEFMRDFVDGLNSEKLLKNINKFYQGNLHEFRVMIHQLCYGSEAKKKEFAKGLKPMVENAMLPFPGEKDHENILEAYYRLDMELCTEICIKLKKDIPKKVKSPEEEEENVADGKEEISEFQELDKKGEDYDMPFSKLSPEAEATNKTESD